MQLCERIGIRKRIIAMEKSELGLIKEVTPSKKQTLHSYKDRVIGLFQLLNYFT